MTPLSTGTRRLAAVVATAAAAVALTAAGPAASAIASADAPWSASALDCGPADALGLGVGSSAARVRDDAKDTQEPKLYPDNEAKAYGVLPDKPYLGDATVTIPTVFHMIGGDAFTDAEKARWKTLIANQMRVLNDSFGGRTAADASNTPFQFQLTKTTWTVNPAWYNVTPGKAERDMKSALYEGDSRVLNVYAADIGGGLLGWAYFPKGYNNGRDFIDGVVMLDESMPGGTAGKYALGDTLTHEVGHWLMLDHTFNKGCSAAGDYVDDTPKEAHPQFNCPVDADTCSAPGLDPIHNFMDYTQDSCMNMFTKGQAERMSDAWRAFRASGVGGKG